MSPADFSSQIDRARERIESGIASATRLETLVAIDVLSQSAASICVDLRSRLGVSIGLRPSAHGEVSKSLETLADALVTVPPKREMVASITRDLLTRSSGLSSGAIATPLALYWIIRAWQVIEATDVREQLAGFVNEKLAALSGTDPGTLPLAYCIQRSDVLTKDVTDPARRRLDATLGVDAKGIIDLVIMSRRLQTETPSTGDENAVLVTLSVRVGDLSPAAAAVFLVAMLEYERGLVRQVDLAKRQLFLDGISRFKSATRRLKLPENERDFQAQMWVLVKSLWADADDEQHVGRFADVENKPDFYVPSARLLIDAKFIKGGSGQKELQRFRREVAEKLVAYLSPAKEFDELIIVFFDADDLLAKFPAFLSDFNGLNGITVVVVH